MKATRPDAYRLMHEGALALAEAEHHGMRVDLGYLDTTINEVAENIKGLEKGLYTSKEWGLWRRRFGDKANIYSRTQLGTVLYKDLGVTEVEAGAGSADEHALEKVNMPFTKMYVQLQKQKKLHGTYLLGVRREVEGDLLHFNFNLHTVSTYRSSCQDPNLQNIPIRVPEIAKLIRRAFIPRKGHVLVEIDIVGAEVRCAACYHKDPTMLRYIKDGYDMHRDMAAECYKLPPNKVPKTARQQAKALFVFAEFYGDYYVQVAQSLWEAVTRYGLTTEGGTDIHVWLENKGITSLGECNPRARPVPGTFEHHIKAVEDRFWNERFPIYNKWRKQWYADYLKRGYIETLTGFRIDGLYDRNFIINAPVQGTAFHWLLWSLIQITNELGRNRWRSKVVGQIHDSIVADVHEDELPDFIALCHEVMTERLVKHWPWIITPIATEPEVGVHNWYEKKPV